MVLGAALLGVIARETRQYPGEVTQAALARLRRRNGVSQRQPQHRLAITQAQADKGFVIGGGDVPLNLHMPTAHAEGPASVLVSCIKPSMKSATFVSVVSSPNVRGSAVSGAVVLSRFASSERSLVNTLSQRKNMSLLAIADRGICCIWTLGCLSIQAIRVPAS